MCELESIALKDSKIKCSIVEHHDLLVTFKSYFLFWSFSFSVNYKVWIR